MQNRRVPPLSGTVLLAVLAGWPEHAGDGNIMIDRPRCGVVWFGLLARSSLMTARSYRALRTCSGRLVQGLRPAVEVEVFQLTRSACTRGVLLPSVYVVAGLEAKMFCYFR